MTRMETVHHLADAVEFIFFLSERRRLNKTSSARSSTSFWSKGFIPQRLSSNLASGKVVPTAVEAVTRASPSIYIYLPVAPRVPNASRTSTSATLLFRHALRYYIVRSSNTFILFSGWYAWKKRFGLGWLDVWLTVHRHCNPSSYWRLLRVCAARYGA